MGAPRLNSANSVLLNRLLIIVLSLLGAAIFPHRAAAAEQIPFGVWKDPATGLYVSVSPLHKTSDLSAGVAVANRFVVIGGPPPRKDRADDILLPSSGKGEGTAVSVAGSFNWDASAKKIEASVVWKDGTAVLTLSKNEGYERFPAGTYTLQKEPEKPKPPAKPTAKQSGKKPANKAK